MTGSSRLGGWSRRWRAHILNCNCEREREQTTTGRSLQILKARPQGLSPSRATLPYPQWLLPPAGSHSPVPSDYFLQEGYTPKLSHTTPVRDQNFKCPRQGRHLIQTPAAPKWEYRTKSLEEAENWEQWKSPRVAGIAPISKNLRVDWSTPLGGRKSEDRVFLLKLQNLDKANNFLLNES